MLSLKFKRPNAQRPRLARKVLWISLKFLIILGPYNFILVLVTEFGNTANGNPSVHLFIKPRK